MLRTEPSDLLFFTFKGNNIFQVIVLILNSMPLSTREGGEGEGKPGKKDRTRSSPPLYFPVFFFEHSQHVDHLKYPA